MQNTRTRKRTTYRSVPMQCRAQHRMQMRCITGHANVQHDSDMQRLPAPSGCPIRTLIKIIFLYLSRLPVIFLNIETNV